MRIVALHTDFRIYWPARLKALNEALKRSGDTLHVIEIAGAGSPYSFAVKEKNTDLSWHILFPDEKPENLSGAKIKPKLFSLLDELNPDVIIAGAIAFPSGALATHWAHLKKKKIIIFDDAKINSVPRNFLVNLIKRSVYNEVDALLYPAESWDNTGNFWGFDKERIFYGLDVVDNDFWGKSYHSKIKHDDFFVAVGRQVPKKNFLSIVKAYKRYINLLEPKDCVKLLLVGDGSEHEQIKQYIHQNGLETHVMLLPFLKQEELASVYQKAKALIINSTAEETWGLVINEAMAGGCPILASKQCGATDVLVRDEINGYTFNFNDIETLSNLMHRYCLLSPQQQQAMRYASKEIIKEWGLPRFVQGCAEAINFVASNPKRKSSIMSRVICALWKGRYNPI